MGSRRYSGGGPSANAFWTKPFNPSLSNADDCGLVGLVVEAEGGL